MAAVHQKRRPQTNPRMPTPPHRQSPAHLLREGSPRGRKQQVSTQPDCQAVDCSRQQRNAQAGGAKNGGGKRVGGGSERGAAGCGTGQETSLLWMPPPVARPGSERVGVCGKMGAQFASLRRCRQSRQASRQVETAWRDEPASVFQFCCSKLQQRTRRGRRSAPRTAGRLPAPAGEARRVTACRWGREQPAG